MRFLLQFPAITSEVSIIVAVETLWASLGITIRKIVPSLHLHVLNINVHGGRSLVLRAQVSRWWRGPSWLGFRVCSFDALGNEDCIVEGLGRSDVRAQTWPYQEKVDMFGHGWIDTDEELI